MSMNGDNRIKWKKSGFSFDKFFFIKPNENKRSKLI